jgi:predicted NUDIX family NTP pyrophosphohydrolase
MRTSCGVLVYRRGPSGIEFFLVHPGGPVWAKRDEGVWTIPKGEPETGEQPEETARREFEEETGFPIDAALTAIGTVQQKSGKIVYGFAAEMDIDPARLKSNTFEMEWPPRSGVRREFPEIDRGAWFSREDAKLKINPAQRAFIERVTP